jgi:hypothetical protein
LGTEQFGEFNQKLNFGVYNVAMIPISSRTSLSTNVKEPALPKSQSEVSL